MVSEEGVTAQTAWYKTMQTSSNAAKELFDNEEKLIKSGNSVRLSEEAISNATNTMTFSAKAGEVALKGLAMAGKMLVSLGISAIISLAVKGLDNLVHAADNAKESAESFSNSFKSMNEEFTSNDSKLSDLQKQYNELSKGVNSLGENVSLTLESDIVFTSDVYGYIDADYVITVKEAGDLKFDTYYYNPDTKVYTLDRKFTVKNCIADEKIYVKGDTQLVTSSRTVHELGKDCNFILPRIVNTYQSDDEEVRNKIKSSLKCNVQITYNPTAMIGYGYKS